MKLWIDDIRKNPNDEWHWARTVTEAIRTLATQGDHIEEISIDHDICCQGEESLHGVVSAHTSPETYEAVAWYLLEWVEGQGPADFKNGENFPITIHSANPVGAEKIRSILANDKRFNIKVEPYEQSQWVRKSKEL